MSVAIPDLTCRVVNELAEIENVPLELVRVYFNGKQLKHDLTPVDTATYALGPGGVSDLMGKDSGGLSLSMELAIEVFRILQTPRLRFPCIFFCPSFCRFFQINVYRHGTGYLSPDAIGLTIEPHESVADVKQKIQAANGTPSSQQRLFLAGCLIIDENRKFSDLPIPRWTSPSVELLVLDTKVIACFTTRARRTSTALMPLLIADKYSFAEWHALRAICCSF